jgi:hypothetical protein
MSKFESMAPTLMGKLMTDFQLNSIQAAAILGNLGHESAGFTAYHQFGMPEGRGGYGWAQWDGGRRDAFLQWCTDNGKRWDSDEASEAFLWIELNGQEGHGALPSLRRQADLDAAVEDFEKKFERAGVKAYDSRKSWARKALNAFNAKLGI